MRTVVDIAGEFGLDASVDVIQGHLCSFDFIPAWLSTWHETNMFTDGPAITAQQNPVSALGSAMVSAPNFLGLTLGNEVNQFAGPPHPTLWPATSDEITHWMTSLLESAKTAAPDHPHVHAEFDASFYRDDNPFHPAHAAQIGDLTVIHSWIFNGTAQRYGGLSHESIEHASYMIELARAFATDPNRPTWLQEIGAPLNCLAESETPEFLERAVTGALSTQNLWGITWWCSHDVSRTLGDFPELEHTLGLISADHKVKPLGKAFADVIAQVKANPIKVASRDSVVEIPVDSNQIPLSRADLKPGGSLFEEWMELSKAGQTPAFVATEG